MPMEKQSALLELADELMAMAPTVGAATAEGGAILLREAAAQLRLCHGALERIQRRSRGPHPEGDTREDLVRDLRHIEATARVALSP